MVEAAANWMQAGLPLKCIKIVIYGDNDSDLNSLFSSMKKKITSKTGKKVRDDRVSECNMSIK